MTFVPSFMCLILALDMGFDFTTDSNAVQCCSADDPRLGTGGGAQRMPGEAAKSYLSLLCSASRSSSSLVSRPGLVTEQAVSCRRMFPSLPLVMTLCVLTAIYAVSPRVARHRIIWSACFHTLYLTGSFFVFIYFLPIYSQVSAMKSGIDSIPLAVSQVLAIIMVGVLTIKLDITCDSGVVSAMVGACSLRCLLKQVPSSG